jgi:hypothetical protein
VAARLSDTTATENPLAARGMSAPVVHHLQNRCMRRFHDAGAVDADSAKTLSDAGVRDSLVLRYLKSRGVIREGKAGRYYIDSQAERRFRKRRFTFTVTLICIGIGVILTLLTITLVTP